MEISDSRVLVRGGVASIQDKKKCYRAVGLIFKLERRSASVASSREAATRRETDRDRAKERAPRLFELRSFTRVSFRRLAAEPGACYHQWLGPRARRAPRTRLVPIVQRPRTWPFQGQNTGSNPVGDANTFTRCSARASSRS